MKLNVSFFEGESFNAEFVEANERIDVTYGITEVLTGIGASESDGNVRLFADRESSDDGNGNITI